MNNQEHNVTTNIEWLECEECHQKKPDAERTHCPYAEEINNTIIPTILCKDCYRERLMDI